VLGMCHAKFKHTGFKSILVDVTTTNIPSCAGLLIVVPHTGVLDFLSQVSEADGAPRSRARKDATV
jgi:hypothetical protein